MDENFEWAKAAAKCATAKGCSVINIVLMIEDAIKDGATKEEINKALEKSIVGSSEKTKLLSIL